MLLEKLDCDWLLYMIDFGRTDEVDVRKIVLHSQPKQTFVRRKFRNNLLFRTSTKLESGTNLFQSFLSPIFFTSEVVPNIKTKQTC